MEKDNTLRIRTKDLIALCHILDEYNGFNKKLIQFISTKYNRNLVNCLQKQIKGKRYLSFSSRKIKNFYNKNKKVIDIFNQYSDISGFIYDNYDYKGSINDGHDLNFFYQYILNNREHLEQILSLLERIRELKFEYLELNPNLDFTSDEYKIDTSFNYNRNVTYLDNIAIIPNYQNEFVKYKSTDSDYKIIVGTSLMNHVPLYGNRIIVNSLMFDADKLPDAITKQNIFDRIIELKDKEKERITSLQNSVDLGISVDDLSEQVGTVNKVINSLDNAKTKAELIEVMSSIKESVEKLKTMSTEYDNSMLEKDPTVTGELLEKEKKLELDRRYWASLDID